MQQTLVGKSLCNGKAVKMNVPPKDVNHPPCILAIEDGISRVFGANGDVLVDVKARRSMPSLSIALWSVRTIGENEHCAGWCCLESRKKIVLWVHPNFDLRRRLWRRGRRRRAWRGW